MHGGLWKRLEFGMPVAYFCTASLSKAALLECAKAAHRGSGFVQLFDGNRAILPKLLPAYINALARFSDGDTRAKDAALEMLLIACKTTKINEALERCGIKSGSGFIAFASSAQAFSRFARKCHIETAKKLVLKLDAETASETAMVQLS